MRCGRDLAGRRVDARFCSDVCRAAVRWPARYAANSVCIRALRVARYVADLARSRAANAARYAANPTRQRMWNDAWRRAHPEQVQAGREARRSRQLGAFGLFTAQEWREKCELFANLCAYCGEARPLTVDHKMPLSRGGSNDITNIVPSCKRCNSKKGTRTATEYLALPVVIGT